MLVNNYSYRLVSYRLLVYLFVVFAYLDRVSRMIPCFATNISSLLSLSLSLSLLTIDWFIHASISNHRQ